MDKTVNSGPALEKAETSHHFVTSGHLGINVRDAYQRVPVVTVVGASSSHLQHMVGSELKIHVQIWPTSVEG